MRTSTASRWARAGALNGDTNAPALFDGQNDFVSLSSLGLATAAGGKNTVEFWMYWNGKVLTMPFGFGGYDLFLGWGGFGFNTGNSDLYGISIAGLANRWAHVVAVFTNGRVSQKQALHRRRAADADAARRHTARALSDEHGSDR